MQHEQDLKDIPPQQRISEGPHVEPIWYDGKLVHAFGQVVVFVSIEHAGGQISTMVH